MRDGEGEPRAGGIGELHESALHAQLKALYLAEGGKGEQRIGRWVADVVLSDGRVVEVQTGQFHRLKPKLAALLAERPVRLAFPIAAEKTLLALERPVTVPPQDLALPVIRVSESGFVEGPHKNKYGHDYPPNTQDYSDYRGGVR